MRVGFELVSYYFYVMKLTCRKAYVKKVLSRSWPRTTVSKAYQMKVSKFYPESNMGEIDMPKLDLCDVARKLDLGFKIVRETYAGTREGRCETHPGCFPWEFTEGVSGSAPLFVLENCLKRTRSGTPRGRWKKGRSARSGPKDGLLERREAREEVAAVTDLDIFIGGWVAQRKSTFRRRVKKLIKDMKVVVEKKGMSLKVEREKCHKYALKDKDLLIQDVSIDGMGGMKISFVQSPEEATLADIVAGFDIDVCKVMYNPWRNKLYARMDVLLAVETGHASVCDYFFGHDSPYKFDLQQVKSTLQRMHKYGKRGYAFNRYPAMVPSSWSDRTEVKNSWYAAEELETEE